MGRFKRWCIRAVMHGLRILAVLSLAAAIVLSCVTGDGTWCNLLLVTLATSIPAEILSTGVEE